MQARLTFYPSDLTEEQIDEQIERQTDRTNPIFSKCEELDTVYTSGSVSWKV